MLIAHAGRMDFVNYSLSFRLRNNLVPVSDTAAESFALLPAIIIHIKEK